MVHRQNMNNYSNHDSRNAWVGGEAIREWRIQGQGEREEGDDDEDGDMMTLLAAKERDLILAAELGNALLEKNEEITRQNEKIAEEFSQKLEVGIFLIKKSCKWRNSI